MLRFHKHVARAQGHPVISSLRVTLTHALVPSHIPTIRNTSINNRYTLSHPCQQLHRCMHLHHTRSLSCAHRNLRSTLVRQHDHSKILNQWASKTFYNHLSYHQSTPISLSHATRSAMSHRYTDAHKPSHTHIHINIHRPKRLFSSRTSDNDGKTNGTTPTTATKDGATATATAADGGKGATSQCSHTVDEDDSDVLVGYEAEYNAMTREEQAEFDREYKHMISPKEYRFYRNSPAELERHITYHQILDDYEIKSMTYEVEQAKKNTSVHLNINANVVDDELRDSIESYLSDYTRFQERIDDNMGIDDIIEGYGEFTQATTKQRHELQQRIDDILKYGLPSKSVSTAFPNASPLVALLKNSSSIDISDEQIAKKKTDYDKYRDETIQRIIEIIDDMRGGQETNNVPVKINDYQYGALTVDQLKSGKKYIQLSKEQLLDNRIGWNIDPADDSALAEELREAIADFDEYLEELNIGDTSKKGQRRQRRQEDRLNEYARKKLDNLQDAVDDAEEKYGGRASARHLDAEYDHPDYQLHSDTSMLQDVDDDDLYELQEMHDEIELMYRAYVKTRNEQQQEHAAALVDDIAASKFLGYNESGDEVYRYYHPDTSKSPDGKAYEDFVIDSDTARDLFNMYAGKGTIADEEHERRRIAARDAEEQAFADVINEPFEEPKRAFPHRHSTEEKRPVRDEYNTWPIPKQKSWYAKADRNVALPPGARDGITPWPRIPAVTDWPHPISPRHNKAAVAGTEAIDPEEEEDAERDGVEEVSERREEIERREAASHMLKQSMAAQATEKDDADSSLEATNVDDEVEEEEDESDGYPQRGTILYDEEGEPVEYDPPLTNPAFYHLPAIQKLLHIERLHATRTFLKMEKIRRYRLREREYRDILKYKSWELPGEEKDEELIKERYKHHNPTVVEWLRRNYDYMIETVHNQGTWKESKKEAFVVKLQKHVKRIYAQWNHKSQMNGLRRRRELARAAKSKVR